MQTWKSTHNSEEYEINDDTTTKYFFYHWCKNEKIVKLEKQGVEYRRDFLDELCKDLFSEDKLISDAQIAPFKAMALLLFWIDRKIDPEKGTDYLIALTTCTNLESYLKSIQELLRLYIVAPKYGYKPLLTKLKEYAAGDYGSEYLNNIYNKYSQYSHKAIHGVKHKRKLYKDILKIIDHIEVALTDEILLKNIYQLNLLDYTNSIRRNHQIQPLNKFVRIKKDIEQFGDICICFSNLLKTV